MSTVPVSKPIFLQKRIICPRCGYNNVANAQDVPGATVNCGGCYHEFIVGD
jgi:transcription elongation factor Elf1